VLSVPRPRPVRRRAAPVAVLVAAIVVAGCAGGGTQRSTADAASDTPPRAEAGAPTGIDERFGAARTLQDALERNLADHPAVPGEAAAVLLPGERVEAAAGYADPDARVPLTPDTPFRIASVTKTFVAVAALRLVEQGRLELDRQDVDDRRRLGRGHGVDGRHC